MRSENLSTLFQETMMTFKKVDRQELRKGSLSQIFSVKHDHALMSWFISLPLDSRSAEHKQLYDSIRRTCMEMNPCINRALHEKMCDGDVNSLAESLSCLEVKYRELETALIDLTAEISPQSLQFLKQVRLS